MPRHASRGRAGGMTICSWRIDPSFPLKWTTTRSKRVGSQTSGPIGPRASSLYDRRPKNGVEVVMIMLPRYRLDWIRPACQPVLTI